MFIEILLVRLFIFTVAILSAYILGKYIVIPIFGMLWKPHQIVLDAERKKRIAKANLEATQIEIETTKTWEQCEK